MSCSIRDPSPRDFSLMTLLKLKSSLWQIIVANTFHSCMILKELFVQWCIPVAEFSILAPNSENAIPLNVSSSSDFFACIITLAIIASPHSVLKFSEKTKSCRFTDLLLCQRVPDYISWLLDQFYTYFHTCTKTLYFWYYFLNTLHLTLN